MKKGQSQYELVTYVITFLSVGKKFSRFTISASAALW
jgi:hypothetical protein